LSAFVANHQQRHFTYFLVHLCRQPQVIRPAFEAGHVKLAERTASGRLARLVIFPAHEISRGIHATKLSHALDNACPTENLSFGFSYCPGNRRIQFQSFSFPNFSFSAQSQTTFPRPPVARVRGNAGKSFAASSRLPAKLWQRPVCSPRGS
jgi:hypothetical protein